MLRRVSLGELPQEMTVRDLAKVAHALGVKLSVESAKADPPDIVAKYTGSGWSIGPCTVSVATTTKRCAASTLKGERCRNDSASGSGLCHVHARKD